MGENGFKTLIFGFVLFVLFGMLLITAVNQAGSNYGKNLTEVTGGSLDFNKFNNTVSDFEQQTNAFHERFISGNVWSAIAGVVVEGIFGIGRDMFMIIYSPFGLIKGILENVLSVPTFVTTIITGLLILTFMFALWRLIKIGD